MKRFFSIFLCLSLASCALAPALTGCKSSPQLIAYQSADAVISSVDAATREWALYSQREHKRLHKLPAIEQGTQLADLLRKEGRVATAHGQYVAAMEAAEVAVGIAYTKRGNLPQSVSDAAAKLVATIKEVRK